MATFVLRLQLSTLDDLDHLLGLVARSLGNVFDGFNHLITFKDLTENNMAAIEPSIPPVSMLSLGVFS